MLILDSITKEASRSPGGCDWILQLDYLVTIGQPTTDVVDITRLLGSINNKLGTYRFDS